MRYYVALVGIILFFTWKEYATRKQEYDDARGLNKDFEKWVSAGGEGKRPNNALFVALFKKCYGKNQLSQSYWKQEGRILNHKTIDVLASFPTTHRDALPYQYGILDNLEDYYELQYKEMNSFFGLINYVISLPLVLLRYIGLDTEKSYSKVFQLTAWLIGLFTQQIADSIVSLIKSIFNLK